jgi:hypothetical protein
MTGGAGAPRGAGLLGARDRRGAGPLGATYTPIALDVLALRGGELAAVLAFRSTGDFARFGLCRTR